MADVTVIGGGAARACADVLARAGGRVHHAFELESGDHSPVILGEVASAPTLARQALDAGRHLLIASPLTIPPERLASLIEDRMRSQALFLWSERRYHPGYRFVAGLIEADATWRPRYLRQETLLTDAPAAGPARWRIAESIALLQTIAAAEPRSVAAASVDNPSRGAPDLVSVDLAFAGLAAVFHLGFGEAVERRETLVAAAKRKAFVDELNQSMPVRLVEDEPVGSGAARWLSCTSPGAEELVRQQCLAFFDATVTSSLAQAEAEAWQSAIAGLHAVERSLAASGATTAVERQQASREPRFRLIPGRLPA